MSVDSTQTTSTSPAIESRSRADALLRFWFGSEVADQATEPQAKWFTKDPSFDEAFRSAFLEDYEAAINGQYESWRATAETTVALVVLLDQFPRNVFRNRAEAFASDAQARDVARHALAQKFDEALPPVWRWFLYLPFEHSESLEDQRLSMRLFESLRGHGDSASAIDYARRHLEIIERFGRFPHRNAALERTSTEEELQFLKQPNSSF